MDNYIVVVECAIEYAGKLLMIERPLGKHAEGLLAFPGGKIEVADQGSGEDPLKEAVKREVFEEVGIKLKTPLHYVTSSVFADEKTGQQVIDALFHCIVETPPKLKISKREVPHHEWLTPDEIKRRDNCPVWLVKQLEALPYPQKKELNVDDTITLKSLSHEYAKPIFRLIENNREDLRLFMGWVDSSKHLEDTEAFITSELKNMQLGKSQTFVIFFQQAVVGLIDLHEIDRVNRSAMIGYWLDKSHQGKGIMTQAVKRLITEAFQIEDLHRVAIICAEENTKSQSVAERLGFKKEGLLQDAVVYKETFFNGCLYGMTKNS